MASAAAVAAVGIALLALPVGDQGSMEGIATRGDNVAAPPPRPVIALSGRRVAIFPGMVFSSDSLSHFGESFSDALYQLLDGAGGVDAVDPNQLSSALRRRGHRELGTEEGRDVARHLGAGLFILSRMSDVDRRLRVTSSLYRTDAPREAIQETFIEGRPEDLVAMAQGVAVNLLSGYLDWDARRAIPSKQIVTVNPEALRAYLEGLRHYRAGSLGLAQDAFVSAVAADSSFSQAWFARAMLVGGAAAGGRAGIESIEDALHHASGLSTRDSTLLEAAHAFYVEGRLADELTRSFVSRYPAHSWGWYWRAVTLIWHGWKWGESPSNARAPLEHLLALEPNHYLGLIMRHWVATFEERFQEEDSLGVLLASDAPTRGQREFVEGMRTLRSPEGPWRDVALLEMAGLSPGKLIQIATWDWRFAEAARLLADPTTPSPGVRATGFVLLALADAGRGRWQSATENLDAAAQLDPGLAAAYRGYMASLPFLDLDPEALRRVRDEVDAWDGGFRIDPGSVAGGWGAILLKPPMPGPLFKTYLLGHLAGRLGDSDEALLNARLLEEAMPGGACTDQHVQSNGTLPPPALGTDLALEIRSVVAMAEGDSARALELLRRMALDCCHPYDYGSPLNLRPIGRFLRAELLAEAGEHRQALGWFTALGAHGGTEELLFGPIAYLRRAQLEERLGRPIEARHHYQSFEAAWESADPRLQHLVGMATDAERDPG